MLFRSEYRQYGIADFDENGDPRTAGFSGTSTDDYKEDRQGATFSIQGNILLDVSVIDNMEANFNNTTGTLADKLMAAMQGANFAGADSRCLSAGTSSTTAYLLVYRPEDDPADPYIRLNVGQQASGIEPIDILQGLYDDFLSVAGETLQDKISVFPNPVSETLHIRKDPSVTITSYQIMDMNGKLVMSTTPFSETINVSVLQEGIYFIKFRAAEGTTSLKFIKK